MVRRNNSILGAGKGRVKGFLVHCTSNARVRCRNASKSNKMKHLNSEPASPSRPRSTRYLM
jgi:hypothetical protein